MKNVKTLLPSALLTLALLTACATDKAKADARKQGEKKQEYVLIYPTGSNIPVRVPKSQSKSSELETRESQDALRHIQELQSGAVSALQGSIANGGAGH